MTKQQTVLFSDYFYRNVLPPWFCKKNTIFDSVVSANSF